LKFQEDFLKYLFHTFEVSRNIFDLYPFSLFTQSTCRIKTKSKKWYRRVLFHFLDLSLVNSYILFKEICSSLNKKVPNLYEYKLDVALALMYSGSGTADRYVIVGGGGGW
jgi:hypothetical protein